MTDDRSAYLVETDWLIGNDRMRVYDASLMEWSADDSLPMTDPSAVDGG